MPEITYPKLAQGPAKPATPEDIIVDNQGITTPNLHRRIDDDKSELEPGEIEKDKHYLEVAAVDSYRTTKHTTHDEDSTTLEVP